MPVASFTSAVRGDKAPDAKELTDLQEGRVIEEVDSYDFPDNASVAEIKSALAAFYKRRAAYRASLPNTGQHYGKSYDGTTWSA